jgi:glycosyltransferase involved in cell wall biosynthesis
MRELATRGIPQLCLTPKASPLAQHLRAMKLPVKEIPWRGGSDPRAIWHVFNTLGYYNIAHCHDAHAFQVALLPARLRNAKIIAARRVPFKTNPLKWNRADIVIAVSRHVRDMLLNNGIEQPRIRVIHSGTDAVETNAVEPYSPIIRQQRNVPVDAFVVATAALLIPLKGQLIVPAAAALLPDVHWFIAGDGPMRGELESAIARYDVAGRVHMLGWLPDARRLFKEIDAYLSASTEDGLGNSVTESLAMGVPVLSADGGGGAEIVRPVHERTHAVLYRASDARALADAVENLKKPEVRRSVLAAQQERFPDFDIHRTAEQTLQVYQELMQ